jgi:5-(hydroxymethyl)furfural/furfural oxidase
MMSDPEAEFDLVIVGAGPAGCVLANRLSDDASMKVLLVEAGPDAMQPGAENADVLNPFCLTASSNPSFSWSGLTASLRADNTTLGGETPFVQGFGVGGGSNINGMGVDRGQPGDYDEWRDLGADGWAWSDVLPYFKKLEHDLDFEGPNMAQVHGSDGPMPVRRLPPSAWAPFPRAVAEALKNRGYGFVEDYMSDFRDGVASAPTNSLVNQRVSAASAYLTATVRNRANLTILADSLVERVLFEGKRVAGVVLNNKSKKRKIRCRHVVAACGAIFTPALLLRSGVGPAHELAKNNIQPVQVLPGVGRNLQNHPCISLTTYLPPGSEQSKNNPFFLQNWLRYSSNLPGEEPSDMHLMPFNRCDWHALGRRIGLITVSVMKSHSRGTVSLKNVDAATPPQVDFNLLSDERDEQRVVSGLRFALTLLSDPVVANSRRQLFTPNAGLVAALNKRTTLNRLLARGIVMLLDRSWIRQAALGSSFVDPATLLADAQRLQVYARTHVQPQFHVCGTAKMGRSSDPDSVVDRDGSVLGVTGLSVADASIFPTIPRGYTHFIVLMAAEKLSGVIKRRMREPFVDLTLAKAG